MSKPCLHVYHHVTFVAKCHGQVLTFTSHIVIVRGHVGHSFHLSLLMPCCWLINSWHSFGPKYISQGTHHSRESCVNPGGWRKRHVFVCPRGVWKVTAVISNLPVDAGMCDLLSTLLGGPHSLTSETAVKTYSSNSSHTYTPSDCDRG